MTKFIIYNKQSHTTIAERNKVLDTLDTIRRLGKEYHTTTFPHPESGEPVVSSIWLEFDSDEEAVMFKLTHL